LRKLKRKVSSVVAPSQGLKVIHTTGQILQINAGNSICFSGVSADIEELWILERSSSKIEIEYGIVYSSSIARLYQLSGIHSLPSVHVKPVSGPPVMEKKDFKTSPSRYPSGYSADLLDMKR
jgi:hypothetical protein